MIVLQLIVFLFDISPFMCNHLLSSTYCRYICVLLVFSNIRTSRHPLKIGEIFLYLHLPLHFLVSTFSV